MTLLTSRANEHFQRFLSLTTSKGLKKEKYFLLSGESLIREFLKSSKLVVEAELVTENFLPIVPHARKNKTYQLANDLFKDLDILGTKYPLLVVEQPPIPDWSEDLQEGLTLLAPLGDPGNLGALARSAKAFGVKEMVLLKESAHPFLPKALKASAGAMLDMKLSNGPSIQSLSGQKDLVVLDMHGKSLPEFKWPKKSVLLVGEEGPGIPNSLRETSQRLSIPILGVESLNAVVAASLALYDHQTKSKN